MTVSDPQLHIATLQRELAWALLKIQALQEELRKERILKYGPRSETLSDLQLKLLDQEPGVSREEVMAIGDNHNDLEMLEFAGIPVVMGNSVPELKTFGWHETGTNDESGVAAAIKHFAFREAASCA